MTSRTFGPYHGAVTSPGANANIFLQSLPAIPLIPGAYYKVDWTFYIDGTTASATDDDNIGVIPFGNGAFSSALPLAIPATPAGVTPVVTKYSFIWQYQNQSSMIAFLVPKTVAAGTTGSVYHASAVVTQVDTTDDQPGDA